MSIGNLVFIYFISTSVTNFSYAAAFPQFCDVSPKSITERCPIISRCTPWYLCLYKCVIWPSLGYDDISSRKHVYFSPCGSWNDLQAARNTARSVLTPGGATLNYIWPVWLDDEVVSMPLTRQWLIRLLWNNYTFACIFIVGCNTSTLSP